MASEEAGIGPSFAEGGFLLLFLRRATHKWGTTRNEGTEARLLRPSVRPSVGLSSVRRSSLGGDALPKRANEGKEES